MAKDRVRAMGGILGRLSNFLIYMINNNLFAKGKELKYVKDTSRLLIDQIETDGKATDTFLREMSEENSNDFENQRELSQINEKDFSRSDLMSPRNQKREIGQQILKKDQ